jgi:hypothetical protein
LAGNAAAGSRRRLENQNVATEASQAATSKRLWI